MTWFISIIFNRRTENELKCEWEKHRLTKDELTKTKLNLQYTKTQAAVGYMTDLWSQTHESMRY